MTKRALFRLATRWKRSSEDVQSLRDLLLDDLQVGLPHVRAHVADARASLLSKHAEEAQQRLDRAVLGHEQNPWAIALDLVYQGGVAVALAPLPFVHADGLDAVQVAMLQAVFDHRLDRAVDRVPAGAERLDGLLPAKAPRPLGQEKLVGPAKRALAFGPEDALHRFDKGFGGFDAYPVKSSARWQL